jgi:type I restriction enzyme, S subunit
MEMKVKIKDIALYSKGSQINGNELVAEGKYDYMNGGVNPSGKWIEANCKAGTITISEGGNSCGYVNYMSEPFWCGAHCYYLYDTIENSKYLYYALKSQQESIMKLRSGACMPNIKKNDLGNFEFKFNTDVNEQNKITCVLSKIEDVIVKRKSELHQFDELIKSRFIELFGDPVSNSRGLPENTLPEMGEFGRGVSKHRPRNDPKLLGGKHPLIQTGDVAAADLYITEYNSTYSDLGLAQSKMWKKGTLCITIAANIAKTAILDFDACFPDSVVGFIANEKTNNVYIHYWFSFFQRILEAQAPESAQKNINLKILSELKVICPDKDEQDAFAAFVAEVDKSKFVVQQSLRELETLKKSLMQKYFG